MSNYCKTCIHNEVCGLTHCDQSIACCDFVSGWISVKDRLPDQTDLVPKVLFVTKTDGIFTGSYFKAGVYSQFDGWYSMCVRFDNVTHWMPLPEPPKEA